jgi:hypothetical protein
MNNSQFIINEQIEFASFPQELKQLPQWVMANGKVPIQTNGRKASSTDSSTWSDFQTVYEQAKLLGYGVGFMLTSQNEYCCIDLDVKDADSLDKEGKPYPLEKWTTEQQIKGYHSGISNFDSYTERSKSGKGFHIWIKGNIGEGKKRDGVEVYSQERFIVCTGDVYLNKPISARPQQLAALLESMGQQDLEIDPIPDQPEVELDTVVINKAMKAANGKKFDALFRGEWKELNIGDGSQSPADMALFQMIAFYTPNNEQLKRIFLKSALGQRVKAERRNYLDGTIASVRQRQAADKAEAAALLDMTNLKEIIPKWLEEFDAKRNSVSTVGLLLLSEDEIASEPPTEWLIREVLPKQGIAAIYGPSGSGKSFLVLDMLAAIANGRDWFGCKVKPVPVVYAALEGRAGIGQRVRAYQAENGKMNMTFIKARFDIREKEIREWLIDEITKAGLSGGVLCIDTLAASAPGIEENASKDMGELINHMNELQERLGGCVLMVHHSGKDTTKGLRGWSGLRGALDAAIEVTKTGSGRAWNTDKVKEGRDDQVKSFNLKQVQLGLDEDGLPITSCVVSAGGFNTNSTEETSQLILKMIAEFYTQGQYISTAKNSKYCAYNLLRVMLESCV